MDITEFAQSDTCELDILHPITGKKTDIKVEVHSMDSKQYRKAMAAVKDEKDPALNNVKILAMMTTGWKNISYKGKKLNYSQKNAIKIYVDGPWIANQVEAGIFNRVNFMKGKS